MLSQRCISTGWQKSDKDRQTEIERHKIQKRGKRAADSEIYCAMFNCVICRAHISINKLESTATVAVKETYVQARNTFDHFAK